ncbi:hypothetical protein [Kribbella sp. CA-247076]|uniref:hypothetical protein n=1 Tax=Kribbella sp. CA-247076 TaxID=3239941 RepID=UPI003D90D973
MNENNGWPQPPRREPPGYQPPGYQPSPSLRTTAYDVWPGLPSPGQAARPRGNLLALAFVVGLFAFFIADAVPGGPNAVVTFFVATAAVLVLFLLAVAVAVLVRRVRATGLTSFAPVPGQRVAPIGPATAAAAEVEYEISAALPGSRQYFLQVVDELLAALDVMPEYEGRELEESLLRFATTADLGDLVELIERRRLPAIQQFVRLAEQLTKPQLRYLAVVLKARKVLR